MSHHTISTKPRRRRSIRHLVRLSLVLGLVVGINVYYRSVQHSRILGETTANLTVSNLAAAINLARQTRQVSPLQPNSQLESAAQAKAQDIIAQKYWAHTPSPTVSPWRFLDVSGYRYLYAGENLARHFSTSAAVVDAWLASPGHRDNLLNQNYTQMGLSILDNTSDQAHSPVIVAIFAEPLPPSLDALTINPQDRYSTTSLLEDSLPVFDFLLLGLLIVLLLYLLVRIIFLLKHYHHLKQPFQPSLRLWRK